MRSLKLNHVLIARFASYICGMMRELHKMERLLKLAKEGADDDIESINGSELKKHEEKQVPGYFVVN